MGQTSDRSRRWLSTPVVVMTTTTVIFAAVALALTGQLRADLRAQILRREAESLRSMVSLQEERAKDELATFGLGTEPGDWFVLLLETSRLRGVAALRLFDSSGALRDALPMPGFAQIPLDDWRRLEAGESFARLHPLVALDSLRIGNVESVPDGGVPLLEVLVPLRVPGRTAFGGVAQYWIDGAAMQHEFSLLDRHLWWRNGVPVALGAALILATLGWAFRRLRAAHREVQARSEDLARANREFSLAAKTSALGTITAHLIHGLNNPLAGLEGYVSSQPNHDDDAAGQEWRTALRTTQRIRTLVNDVVAILREENSGGAKYRMTTAELLAAAEEKIRPLAAARQVTFTSRRDDAGELSGRRGHLALLVLDNLLTNACEATPAGGHVTLWVQCGARDVVFLVEDGGPGLARHVRDQLFQPVASTKPGGGGIGLVLSHSLAQHAGGLLTLEKSDADGCRFRLVIPLETTAPHFAQ